MRKVVINAAFGGFSLSREAILRMREWGCTHTGPVIKGDKYDDGSPVNSDYGFVKCPRDCSFLVRAVQELGEKADGSFARLKIVEIPDDVEWTIEEYDGSEWVAENHRTWR